MSPSKLGTSQRHGMKPPSGAPLNNLAVMCWCEAEIVWASPAEVSAGVTHSCGRHGCEDPDR